MYTIDKRTIISLVSMLDTQYRYINSSTTKDKATQTAYYSGMKVATEVLLSRAYADTCNIEIDNTGHHQITLQATITT